MRLTHGTERASALRVPGSAASLVPPCVPGPGRQSLVLTSFCCRALSRTTTWGWGAPIITEARPLHRVLSSLESLPGGRGACSSGGSGQRRRGPPLPPPQKVACSLVAELRLTPSRAVRVEPSHSRGRGEAIGGRGALGPGSKQLWIWRAVWRAGAGGGRRWQFQLHSPGSLCAFPWSLERT